MTSEEAVRKRNIPSEASSSGTIGVISSKCWFLMSFEGVIIKRSMPSEPKELSSWQVIKMMCSGHGFVMSFDAQSSQALKSAKS